MIDAQQYPPRQGYAFALEEAFENYAIALKENARNLLGSFSAFTCALLSRSVPVGMPAWRRCGANTPCCGRRHARGPSITLQQRPATGAGHFVSSLPVLASRRRLSLAAGRCQQSA